MIQNFLKVAWRNLMKHRAFSFINIFGLSVGLTCCILITLYLLHETSYDSYQVNGARLYQVTTDFILDGKAHRGATAPARLAEVMQQAFPQVEATARIKSLSGEDKTLFRIQTANGDQQSFYEQKGFLADSGFFRLFTYQFIEGSPSAAVSGPYSLVLSETIATQLFGSASAAINKTVHISSNTNGDHDYMVTGVFRPSAIPSHIDAQFFLSMYGGNFGDYIKQTTNLANNNQFYTYLLLKPGTDAARMQQQMPSFVDTYLGKDLKQAGFYKKQYLLPVRDIHLHADTEEGEDVTPTGSTTYLYILGCIALFTLLIACINFMNLTTARSIKRSSEVGVRKAMGAGRSSLIYQFLGEALMMTLIAFCVSLLLSYYALPGFEKMAGKDLSFSTRQLLELGAMFLGMALVTGLVAGSYPAFYLSSFQPVRIMKGKLTNSLAATNLRKGLVIFQFIISVILIIASVVIERQMHYLREADLGFSKDHQLVIPLRGADSRKNFSALKTALGADPSILSIAGSFYYPGLYNGSDQLLYKEGADAKAGIDTKLNYTDFDFLKTLDIQPLVGRVFSTQFPSDSVDGIVLNETAVRQIGYTPSTAVGKNVYNTYQGQVGHYRIVGVVKDFHFEDLHVPIGPYGVLVQSTFNRFTNMIVHLKAGDPASAIAFIGHQWKQINPAEPMEYSFLDEQFQKNYDADTRLSNIVGYFTAIAISISCLGLFGLAAFSAEQRTKEIGIRKVLGASEASIVTMLSGDFLKLVGIAILVASPIAWLIMHQWLDDFAYKTSINWTVFAYTTLAALLIAMITISFQAIRAAKASPVKSLKSE